MHAPDVPKIRACNAHIRRVRRDLVLLAGNRLVDNSSGWWPSQLDCNESRTAGLRWSGCRTSVTVKLNQCDSESNHYSWLFRAVHTAMEQPQEKMAHNRSS